MCETFLLALVEQIAKSKDPDSDIFDGILGLDGGVDNLFG